MGYNMVMKKVNLAEVKANLSRYLDRVEQGDTIIVCRRNRPIAEIRPLPESRTRPRPLGLAAGTFTVPPSFFEPLPDDLVDRFEGHGGAEPGQGIAEEDS